jgi:hypothetical protein
MSPQVSPPKLPPVLERLYRAGHLRLPTRDLASLDLPRPHVTVRMSATEALMLDRGRGGEDPSAR